MSSLPGCLRQQYKERWDVLLDALFSGAEPQRAALMNPFLKHKNKDEILSFRGVGIQKLVDEMPTEFLRDEVTGLLSQYWCYPSAVLPILFANPGPTAQISVLGDSPPSRLLALCFLLLASGSEQPNGDSYTSNSRHSFQARPVAAIETTEAPQKMKRASSCFSCCDWSVYGEGQPYARWQGPQASNTSDGSQGPKNVNSGATLHWLLEAVLLRSIQAGCCAVKTSSGDWSHVAGAAIQQAATPPRDIQERNPHEDFRGREVKLGAQISLHLASERSTGHIAKLLCNFIPRSSHQHIRVYNKDGTGFKIQEEGDKTAMDLIVVEAPTMTDRKQILSACREGSRKPWPDEEAKSAVCTAENMLKEAFKAVAFGGRVLFCSASLVHQDTDDVIWKSVKSFGRAAKLIKPQDLPKDPLHQDLLLTAKKLGLEETSCGWRMLPDLSFQEIQYFSLIEKVLEA